MPSPCLGFGGLTVQLCGPWDLASPLLAPFLVDTAPDLRLHLGGGRLARADFVFERVDFALRLDFEAGEGEVAMDSGGALAALLGLTVQTMLLWRREGLVLHASAGLHEGRAWVACGRSEAGKSTAARVAGFERILSDEMVVVRPGSEGWTAWSTPFWSQGRTAPLVNESAPLHRLVRLHQAGEIRARPLAVDALGAHLLESVTLHQDEPWARAAAFEMACDLAEAVPGVDLWFTKEDPWIPVACRI